MKMFAPEHHYHIKKKKDLRSKSTSATPNIFQKKKFLSIKQNV